MSCPDECFKIDMGCNCPPPPPSTPRPYMFTWLDGVTGPTIEGVITFQATAGIITGYTILNPGVYYMVAPIITIVGTGTGATATCTINAIGQIVSVTITAGGTGYGVTSTSTLAKGTTNQILLGSLYYPPIVHSEVPLLRLTAPVPYGAGVTLNSAKIQIVMTYTVETNGATDFTGTFYLNGNPIAGELTVSQTSATHTQVCHYSGEVSLTVPTDSFTYKITSTESKLRGLIARGTYTVKFI